MVTLDKRINGTRRAERSVNGREQARLLHPDSYFGGFKKLVADKLQGM